jgi:hypothetical protein
MKLHGKRILIEKPVKPESQVLLTAESEAVMEQEWMKSWTKLKVHATGSECTNVQPGDLVYVGNALANSEIIDIEGSLYFLVNEAAVCITW